MAVRGRSYGEARDWDPMRDEYNTSYDQMYADDDISGSEQINPRRLYITNIPSMLNDEGLRTAFSHFGTLEGVFVSRDPKKKYGMVTFETSGEAKLAMMKMNGTEPLKLAIKFAQANKKGQSKDREWVNNTRDRSCRAEANSIGSHLNQRQREETSNGNDMEDLDNDLIMEDSLDPEIHLELENLKLQQLKVQAEQLQCKHRMLLLKQAEKKASAHHPTSNIQCILPDGRIVARNMQERSEHRDGNVSFDAGAGDSLTIPGLQTTRSRVCVRCGKRAEAYCARCGVAPYCSQGCQRRDWHDRHKAICHNLARLPGSGDVDDAVDHGNVTPAQPAAPLRRPRSPVSVNSGSEKYTRPSQSQQIRSNRGRGMGNSKQGDRRSYGKQFNGTDTWDKAPEPSQPSPKAKQHLELDDQDIIKEPPKAVSKPRTVARDVVIPKEAVSDLKPPRRVANNVSSKMNVPTSEVKLPPKEGPVPETLVPESYVLGELSPGDAAVLTVEAPAEGSRGFLCVAMHERYEEDYQKLCEDFAADCEADTVAFTPALGQSFSYLDADGGWYRARLVSPGRAALLDAARLAPCAPPAPARALPPPYRRLPEYSCLLHAPVQVGNNLKCTILSKNNGVCSVAIEDIETGASIGKGEVSRWLPAVEYPKPVEAPAPAPTPTPAIPQVSRPALVAGSEVFLVALSSPELAIVRRADSAAVKRYDGILQDVVQYARTAAPLSEPPQKGRTVLYKADDGVHYRALCKRTNAKLNKYLLELIDIGTVEIAPLEKLCSCPSQLLLQSRPAESSAAWLGPSQPLAPPALDYIRRLKDGPALLTLTLPAGAKTAPSGSEATLTLVKNNENVNRTIAEMCTPEWKKLEEYGMDVVELECLMHSELKYQPLPASGCELEILDISDLRDGTVSACIKGDPHAHYVHTTLTEKIGEYCNSQLGKQPYMPRVEELCIAQCPPYPQWFRAIVLDLPSGPGGDSVRLCYMDYGNVETVPVRLLRKMLPEFVRGLPAAASLVDIKDFPVDPSAEVLARAVEFMQINDEGRGVLRVTHCQVQEEAGMYACEAPALIAAVKDK